MGANYQVMKRKHVKRKKMFIFVCKYENVIKYSAKKNIFFSKVGVIVVAALSILRYRRVTCTFYPRAGLGR